MFRYLVTLNKSRRMDIDKNIFTKYYGNESGVAVVGVGIVTAPVFWSNTSSCIGGGSQESLYCPQCDAIITTR